MTDDEQNYEYKGPNISLDPCQGLNIDYFEPKIAHDLWLALEFSGIKLTLCEKSESPPHYCWRYEGDTLTAACAVEGYLDSAYREFLMTGFDGDGFWWALNEGDGGTDSAAAAVDIDQPNILAEYIFPEVHIAPEAWGSRLEVPSDIADSLRRAIRKKGYTARAIKADWTDDTQVYISRAAPTELTLAVLSWVVAKKWDFVKTKRWDGRREIAITCKDKRN